MTPTILSFTDYDGRRRHVPVNRVIDVREPGSSPNDNGSVRIDTGGPAVDISFSNGGCRVFLKEWQAAMDEAETRR